ncbi:MAG: ATP-binding cassette domain-containing protein [Caldilineaceae bacterium]|nr:ATP-binding cassette domain-containing protein [Caldilineaceae bacterium]
MEPLLTITNLTKRFGTLTVLDQINLTLYPGEVVGLAGRSGSGKSVLTKLIAGLYAPTEGEIAFADKRLRRPTLHYADIAVIYQEPELAENLDVTENIFLGNEIGWSPLSRWLLVPNRRRMDEAAAYMMQELGVYEVALHEKAANLSGEQRQLIAIAQAMAKPAQLVVIDELAAALRYDYQQQFLRLIQNWQRQGRAVLFCSRNLEHLMAATDRIVTINHGRQVGNHRTDEVNREQIVAEMVGAGRNHLSPAAWALDSYYRVREQAEKLLFRQTLLEKDLVAQDTLNRQLLEQLNAQVTALDRVNNALQAAQLRLLTEREAERKHLARELHDEVIQDLLSVNYELEDMEIQLADVPVLRQQLPYIRADIRMLIEDIRRICGDLRPPTIDSLGLGAAIQSYSAEWMGRTGIHVNLDLDANLGRLPEMIELAIFRIVQEGLSNVRKHAEATTVDISLKHTSQRMLMISIADNGGGLPQSFDPSKLSAAGHYGLLGISERVALMGGHLKVQNQPFRGAILRAEIAHPRVKAVIDAD